MRPPSTPASLRRPSSPSTPDPQPRFLSEADCQDIAHRLARYAKGGGYTIATIYSTWRGTVRWARNQLSVVSEDQNDHVLVTRTLRTGATNVRAQVELNATTEAALVAAARRAERLAQLTPAVPESDLLLHFTPEPVPRPTLFYAATVQLPAGARVDIARQVAQQAADAGLLSAGYLAVSAHSLAKITSWGYARYLPYTWAQVSVTVRDPTGTGSGWAGVDWPDWSKIEGLKLSAIALEKCLQSRHPVAIEPGRYTTILEPQAVCDFVGQLVYGEWSPLPQYQMLDREWNERSAEGPFNRTPPLSGPGPFPRAEGVSQLGARVVDERITLSADPLDPDLGFPSFSNRSSPYGSAVLDDVYHPVTWIEHGVLTALSYNRSYGLGSLGQNTGLPLEGAFRMSGGETSLAEMIATTPRGLLVTRLDRIVPLDVKSLLLRGYTRDGLWLIERGKLSKPVQNMVFTESILFALNNVEQLGPPQRAFHPAGRWYQDLPQPVIVPPLKVRDFAFTALTSAI